MLRRNALLVIFHLLCEQQIATGTAFATKVDPKVTQQLNTGEKVNIVVSFIDGIKSDRIKAAASPQADRGSKITATVKLLEENADKSQASVVSKLSSIKDKKGAASGFKYFKKLSLANKLLVKEADINIVRTIEQDLNVTRINIEPVLKSPAPPKNKPNISVDSISNWGVRHMQVPQAWAFGGKKGEGVLVGSIGSGVRKTHEALQGGFYDWFDALEGNPVPEDRDGYSTFNMGIIAGRLHEIGVAPGVDWMTCRACDQFACTLEAIYTCMIWMTCPLSCNRAPRVIYMSLGKLDELKTIYESWRNLGIIAVHPMYDLGPNCGETLAPAEWSFAIAVGNADMEGNIFRTSGIGPGPDGTIKPDFMAPGTLTWSSGNYHDSEYFEWTSTSSAAAHVAGVVCLLVSRQPDISYEDVYYILTRSTDVLGFRRDAQCGYDDRVIPNNYFGYGQVNAKRAIVIQNIIMGKKNKLSPFKYTN